MCELTFRLLSWHLHAFSKPCLQWSFRYSMPTSNKFKMVAQIALTLQEQKHLFTCWFPAPCCHQRNESRTSSKLQSIWQVSEVMMRTAFARKILFRFVPWDMQRWHVIVWKWSWRALDCRWWAPIFRREGHGGKFRTMFPGCHVVHPFKCVVKSQACFLHVAQCLDKSLCTWFRIRNIIPTSEDVWWVASSCKWHAWRVRNVPLTACCVRVRKWSCIPPRHWDIDLNGWSSMSCRCPPSSSSRQAESLDVGGLFSNLST